LRRVAKKCHFPILAELKNRMPWQNDSGFVVRSHDCDKGRTTFRELFLDPVQIDNAVMGDRYAT